MFPGTDLSRGFDAALRESARLSDDDDYDVEDDDDDEHNFGISRQTSDRDTDFAYAILPSLGSPPLSRSKSQSALSATTFGGADEFELDSSDDELPARKLLRNSVKFGYGIDQPVASSSGSTLQHTPTSLNAPDLGRRFFGKSSTVTMMKTAMDLRNNFWESEGVTPKLVSRAFPDPGTPESDAGNQIPANRGDQRIEGILPCGCPDYGVPHPVRPPSA